jgi:uncharacterized protein
MDFLLANQLDFGYPFSRVFDRVAMLVAAGLLLLWRGRFKVRSLSGYFTHGSLKSRVSGGLLGLVASITMVGLLLPLLVYQGVLEPKAIGSGEVLQKTLKALLAGGLVSVIEEGFFRGILLTTLLTRFSFGISALISSVVYASVHFISPVKTFVYVPGVWLSGFTYLGALVDRATAPGFYSAFFGLLIVGLTLCQVIRSTRSIYLCIGLHAGWVVGIKLTRVVTEFAHPELVSVGAGERYFLVCQPQTWVAVLATGLFSAWWYRRRLATQRGTV